MAINSKINILDQIYNIYDKFAASLDLACKKYCDHCCTSGVILTTLEGYKIIDRLTSGKNADVIQHIRSASEIKRLRPKITTNRLAQLCAKGVDAPEEGLDNLDLQTCPLLQELRQIKVQE